MDERERRAGDIFGVGGFEAFSDAFDERGLARSKVATQQHDERRRQFGGERAAEGNRLLGRVGDGRADHGGQVSITRWVRAEG